MALFEVLGEAFLSIAKNKVVRDMVLQASKDIFATKFDRESGFTEVKFANIGDDLRVLSEDIDNPDGGFRVMNMDNHKQIETVQHDDLEDTFGDY